MKNFGLSEQQRLQRSDAPAANDDLTIAEHLQALKVSAASDGEDLYRDESGGMIRVPESVARKFVEEHGALHPGDYQSRYQREWRQDFQNLQTPPLW